MDWERLYKEYLERCKSKPLTYNEFVKLREGMVKKKELDGKLQEWFKI
jgi:hypothetical protein